MNKRNEFTKKYSCDNQYKTSPPTIVQVVIAPVPIMIASFLLNLYGAALKITSKDNRKLSQEGCIKGRIFSIEGSRTMETL